MICPHLDDDARPPGGHCDIGAYGSGFVQQTATGPRNFANGAPGSYFTLHAESFPANAQATVRVNGVQIGTAQTDADGTLQVELDTTGTEAGAYIVTVQVNPTASVTIHLDEAAPLRAKQDSGPLLTVPSDLAPTRTVYVPHVIR